MKYALVGGVRQEAKPFLIGECIACGSRTVARCGEIRAHHWAHKGCKLCDPWWETETNWHRAWKNNFPNECQEVVCYSESGEKHIADVKTQSGWVFEFQHSHITPDERSSREFFYGTMIWVIDGARSTTEKKRFSQALEDGGTNCNFPEIKVLSSKKVNLVRSWISSHSPVVFDLGRGSFGGSCLEVTRRGPTWSPFPNRDSLIFFKEWIQLVQLSCFNGSRNTKGSLLNMDLLLLCETIISSRGRRTSTN